MNEDTNRLVQKINTEITKESLAKNEKYDKNIKNEIKQLSEKAPFEKKEAPVNSKENSELVTLAGVDTKLVQEQMDKPADKSIDIFDEASSKKILESYNKNLNESIKTIESDTGLKSDEDIKKFYSLVEEVVKKDGSKQTGAIVTQIGDSVIFHSSKGVNQIQTSEIDYVDYHLK
jgi:hypothetical protein